MLGGFCPRGVLSLRGFVQEVFCPRGVLSQRGFVLGGFVLEGFCPYTDSIMTKCPPRIHNLNQFNNRFGECKRVVSYMSRKIICFLHDIV